MPAGLTSCWGWCWVRGFPDPGRAPKCKTQNSGLCSKEGKPCDPMNQPSRCNTQEGLLSVAQTGDSSPGRQSTPNSKLGKLLWAKNHIISMLHMGYKVIGYTFTKQSYWYKLGGLLFKLRSPRAFQLSRGLLLGAYGLAGSRSSYHFTANRNPSPGRLPAPAPAAPHNKTYFSASKTNKKNIRHMNYRHW